jgi:hypothetical protein
MKGCGVIGVYDSEGEEVNEMKIEGNRIILTKEEVETTVCPRNVQWAARMVELYGPNRDFKGRLAQFSRCPEVLRAAGYEVEIVEEEEVKAEETPG